MDDQSGFRPIEPATTGFEEFEQTESFHAPRDDIPSSVTCPACGYELVNPAYDQSGPCCLRCGDPIPSLADNPASLVALETYLGAAVGGAVLGLVVAAALLLGRW